MLLFQKRGHYSRGDIIQGGTLFKEIRYAEIFVDVFSKNISLIIQEVSLQDFHSVAFLTICEGLKYVTNLNFWTKLHKQDF